jgi:O-antigen ligase
MQHLDAKIKFLITFSIIMLFDILVYSIFGDEIIKKSVLYLNFLNIANVILIPVILRFIFFEKRSNKKD